MKFSTDATLTTGEITKALDTAIETKAAMLDRMIERAIQWMEDDKNGVDGKTLDAPKSISRLRKELVRQITVEFEKELRKANGTNFEH